MSSAAPFTTAPASRAHYDAHLRTRPTRVSRARMLVLLGALLGAPAGRAHAQSSDQHRQQLVQTATPAQGGAQGTARATTAIPRALPTSDATYATPGVAQRFAAYFAQKSAPSVEGVMSHYSRTRTSHSDAVLGLVNPDWQTIYNLFAKAMPSFGAGASYGTRVLGDERSAIVYMVDTPELFGGEIRAISAVDFDDAGKMTRVVDYWDSRNFGSTGGAMQWKMPSDKFPATFREEGQPDRSAPAMRALVDRLASALAAGQADQVAALFDDDAVYEDYALRVQLRGKQAITRYLQRAVTTLPYGPGSAVRHVVGSARGGGYEWTTTNPVRMGITALGVAPNGRIAQLSTVYDAAPMSDNALIAAQRQALDFTSQVGRK